MMDDEDELGPRFPVGVRIAATVWVLFGVFVIINSAIFQWRTGFTFEGELNKFLPILALAFVVIGLRTLSGAAKLMVGNGLGSILAGIPVTFPGVLLLTFAFRALNTDIVWSVKLAAFGLGFMMLGVLLIVAGVLAIRGRQDYLAWREYLNATTLADPK